MPYYTGPCEENPCPTPSCVIPDCPQFGDPCPCEGVYLAVDISSCPGTQYNNMYCNGGNWYC